MTVKDFYERIGQDYTEVYERVMGHEELLVHFLKQFCEDETYAALERAVRDEDIPQIFLEAHTLKGLSANFGLKPLAEKAGVLVEMTRNGGSRGNVSEAFAGIQKVYQEMTGKIQKITAE